jgi:hypothetical protein
MVFAFQSTGLPMHHHEDFINAARDTGHTIRDFGLVPFENKLRGIEGLDPTEPTFFFGSTKMLEILSKDPVWRDQIFFNEQFDSYYEGRSDFLNSGRPMCLKDVKEFLTEPSFIRPISSLKPFGGTVVTPANFDDWLETYGGSVDLETEIIMCPYWDIWAEWRFFIIGGEVVTGSMYRISGALKNRIAPPEMLMTAQALARKWLPDETCVMDLALTTEGFKVIEYNAVHCSGLYDSDPKILIDAIAEFVTTR